MLYPSYNPLTQITRRLHVLVPSSAEMRLEPWTKAAWFAIYTPEPYYDLKAMSDAELLACYVSWIMMEGKA